MVRLKKSEAALAAYAEFVPVYAQPNEYPFVFARAVEDEVILAIFNPADRKASADFKLNLKNKKFEKLMGDDIEIRAKGKRYQLEMDGISYGIYKMK